MTKPPCNPLVVLLTTVKGAVSEADGPIAVNLQLAPCRDTSRMSANELNHGYRVAIQKLYGL